MNSGASTSVIVAKSLINTWSDGPAVSLNGSPTVSPTTAALWASDPLPRTLPFSSLRLPASMYFFALSQAPPPLFRKSAMSTPAMVPIIRSPAAASHPSAVPTITGPATARRPGSTISRSAERTEMSTQRRIVGQGGAGHDAGIGFELAANFFDHVAGGVTDRANGERGEEEDDHGADETADEDPRLGDIDDALDFVANAFEAVDFFQEGGEEQEGGQGGGADGVALGERLGGVADRVEGVGDFADRFRLIGHFDDTAGVVRDRSEGVHRQDVGGGHEHAHRGNRGAEDTGRDGGIGGEVDRLADRSRKKAALPR